MNSLPTSAAGIYIHIPFCKRKCPYCDFYSVTDLGKMVSFVRSAEREIQMVNASLPLVDSIYLGGGTPSLLDAENVFVLLNSVRQKFAVSNDLEITIEVNPGTITLDKLTGYRKAGVNRINIGIQSFQDAYLTSLGRIHTAREAIACFELSRKAGFENIGIDLIYGIPGQTARMWKKDLETAIMLSPEHISCYQLSYEPGTPMTTNLEKGTIHAIPNNLSAILFELTDRLFKEAGYLHYEISNYAISLSTRSRHNLKYWSYASYIGIGPSSHSFYNNRRSWNLRSVDAYIDRIESGQNSCESEEILDSKQQMIETIYLGLRCANGICIDDFEKRFAVDFQIRFGKLIFMFESEGFMNCMDGFCRLTLKGMLVLDSIVERFI
jgi:oxygen-independent coproporphyrinogen III oxidase